MIINHMYIHKGKLWLYIQRNLSTVGTIGTGQSEEVSSFQR